MHVKKAAALGFDLVWPVLRRLLKQILTALLVRKRLSLTAALKVKPTEGQHKTLSFPTFHAVTYNHWFMGVSVFRNAGT